MPRALSTKPSKPTQSTAPSVKLSKKPAKKAAAPKPASAKAKPVAPETTYDPNKDRRALQQIIARRGTVDDDHREAYDELIADEERAKLGALTRAPGVFRDGVSWAVAIDLAMARSTALVKAHYAETRFAYFLDRLEALAAAITAQKSQRGDQGAVRTTSAEREQTARQARQALLAKLAGFAGKRASESAALAEATGRTGTVSELGDSMQALVRLGQEWLAREDRKSKIQCASAGLTEGVVASALAAAEALTGAATTATLAGRRPSSDAPEVNLVEGSVLFEMSEAQRCFNEAHDATRVVPRLIPGAATRHVLGSKKAASKTATAPTTAEGAAAAPAPSA